MWRLNNAGINLIKASGILTGCITLAIITTVTIVAYPAITSQGVKLFTINWAPYQNQYGILTMLYGSIIVTTIALILSVPLALLTAIWITEWLPKKWRYYFKTTMEWLAGVPSIIYGLLGIAILSPWLAKGLDLNTGRTILTAGIILAIMILPTLITLMDDAFHHVPNHYRESAQTLGLYPHEIFLKVILPIAKTDVIGAILLSLGRALGETMAVMLVIGSIDKIPKPWINILQPGQTITAKLGRELPEAAFGTTHFSAMMAMALILLAIVLLITWLANAWFKPESQRYE